MGGNPGGEHAAHAQRPGSLFMPLHGVRHGRGYAAPHENVARVRRAAPREARPSSRRQLAAGRVGSVPFNPTSQLTSEGGVQWLGAVNLGSPRQALTVTMDTGSSDMLVVGARCRDPECLTSPKSYHPNRSGTVVQVRAGLKIGGARGGLTSRAYLYSAPRHG